MLNENKIEIGLNKKKLTNGFITCTCLGILLLILSTSDKYSAFNNQFVKYGGMFISVLFFGFGIFYFLRKLIDKKPGILIDNNGILDNSSSVSVGFINWDDVKQFRTTTSMKQKFLIVEVNNPEHYINKQTNFILKKGMKQNFKHFGSPIAISAHLLKCTVIELNIILEKRLLSRQEYTNS